MDYSDSSDDNRASHVSDSVQWQGSQSLCPALDTLLSETTFKPQPELFRTPRDFLSNASSSSSGCGMKGVSFTYHQSPSPASTSMSLSPFSFTTVPDSGRRGTPDSTPSSSAGSDGPASTPSWQASSNDHRNRLSRASTSTNTEMLSARDRDRFLDMLKGVSARIDGKIRTDASTPRDTLKRRPPSKRIASVSGVKRAKYGLHSISTSHSVPEGTTKGKARDLSALANTSMNIPASPGRSAGSRSRSDHLDYTGFKMDADPPKSFLETMPPPLVPPLRPGLAASPAPDNTFDSSPLRPITPTTPGIVDQNATVPSRPQPQKRPTPQRQNTTPPSSSSTPITTPKLHPLLDSERKQRRLKLERTISASLASLPSEPSFSSPLQTTGPPNRQPYPPPPPTHANQKSSTAPPVSQSHVVGNTSHPPVLGMRRTHTFPLASQNPSTSSGNSRVVIPTKQKAFKPPLLSNSQPISAPPTNSSSRSDVPSSNLSPSSSKTFPGTSIHNLSSRLDDEEMDGLSSSSDVDISFGEVVSFDVDMDALEETMRKYD